MQCDNADWGTCYVRMSNENMVVIYCPQYELVMSGSPVQLQRAGWRPLVESLDISETLENDRASTFVPTSNVISFEQWRKGERPSRPVPAQ